MANDDSHVDGRRAIDACGTEQHNGAEAVKAWQRVSMLSGSLSRDGILSLLEP